MNLPNKITLSRILLVPVFLLFVIPVPEWMLNSTLLSFLHAPLSAFNHFITQYGNAIAAAIFIIAASTDRVDGYIARKTQQVTKFGKFIDPIADKLLVEAALIALVQRNEVNVWVAMIIIAREMMVTGLRLVAASEGIVIAASNWGKIKTAIQMIAIAAILLKNFPISLITDFDFGGFAMLVAVIVTLYSGYDYIVKNGKAIHTDR
jgi:CDP-diacylglycerol---glycerol-3-phosphate 3-phosphatidyltransferase